MKVTIVFCFLFLLIACKSDSSKNQNEPSPEILGIKLGLSREEALPQLQKIATLEKQERKQQEVWSLNGDQPYSHLIISYDKELKSMRFINAVAKEKRVRYKDVIDINTAKSTTSGSNYTYELEVPEKNNQLAYVIKAIGVDPEYLQYHAIEKKGN
jgi:REP element-mobilizing transposase RayT